MIVGIILAAGRSSRFGSNKLLADFLGKPLIRHVVDNALASSLDEVLVVLGHEAELIRQAIPDVKCVRNPDCDQGMSSSVKTGVLEVKDRCSALVIIPADYPLITSNIIDTVITSYRTSGKPIVIACFQGRHGHPVLFDKSLIPEMLKIEEATRGLKSVLSAYSNLILEVETGSRYVLMDVDVVEDLQRVRDAHPA